MGGGVMNKTRKGWLTAGSVVTIVAVSFSIIASVFFFFMGSIMNEKILKKSYRADEEYTYYENADGSYYFTYYEEGVLITMQEDEVELIAESTSAAFKAMGIGVLMIALVKLILVIKILVSSHRNEYARGIVVALLTLSIVNFNWLEAVLLIIAMNAQDNNNKKPLGLDDIRPDGV